MKKTLISVLAITSLVTVSFVALKCRLKPPKKEVFNFDESLNILKGSRKCLDIIAPH